MEKGQSKTNKNCPLQISLTFILIRKCNSYTILMNNELTLWIKTLENLLQRTTLQILATVILILLHTFCLFLLSKAYAYLYIEYFYVTTATR